MEENDKLYVVTADIHDGGYGAEIVLFGVFDNIEKANELKEKLDAEGNRAKVNAVVLNTICEDICHDEGIYLGGYIE